MTDLTDRMQTCAAYLLGRVLRVNIRADAPPEVLDAINDAAALLVEASNVIEAIPQPLGEPWPTLEGAQDPLLPPHRAELYPPQTIHEMTDTLAMQHRERNPRVCPKCDSHANKRADIVDRKILLTCPVCEHQWPWRPHAEWR